MRDGATTSKAKAALLALMLAGATAGQADTDMAAAPAGLTIDRAVLVMRHGVRPPTKEPAMPPRTAAQDWPAWQAKPGWLTPHGATAIRRLGSWDGVQFRALGLLPAKGCPATGAVKIMADSDQRTIATADNWVKALAPGCIIAPMHKPQGEKDAIFSAIEEGLGSYNPAKADDGVAQATGPGGIAALEKAQQPMLDRLDAILCGPGARACGVRAQPSGIGPAGPRSRPKLSGALDRASTAAQILLLEYAEGKPMQEVGWGRASAQDIATLSAFHALEFRLLARPAHIAAANLYGILPFIRAGLTGEARVTMISGHDTNVANLGGLLDVHWTVPGLAQDDPSPGGAILIQRLRDGDGALYVRALYRSQTLEQIRGATPLTVGSAPYLAVMPIPGCTARGIEGLCTLAVFQEKLAAADAG